MSHVVNPILFRLKYSNFWWSTCVANKKFLFFLDAKNIFVYGYLSKVINRMYFIYTRYKIVNFKLIYKSKSMSIFFKLKQRRGLSYTSPFIPIFYKKFERKLFYICMFDIFKNFTKEPGKFNRLFERRHASSLFTFFSTDLYYNINKFKKLKIESDFWNMNMKMYKKYKNTYALTDEEKEEKDKLAQKALLIKGHNIIVSRFCLNGHNKIILNKNRAALKISSYSLKHFIPSLLTHLLIIM